MAFPFSVRQEMWKSGLFCIKQSQHLWKGCHFLIMQQPSKNFNQRATHFMLGSTTQPGGSIYTKDYTEKKAGKDLDYQALDPFRGSAINPPNQSSFSTTNNAMYKNWGTGTRAALDDAKLKDLRTHHFNLGSYNTNTIETTHNQYYNKKELTGAATKDMEDSKNRMRAHYHNFKEQPYTNFKSTYAKQFEGKQGEYAGCIKPESGNAINFGNHRLPMVTTNNSDYTTKEAPYSGQINSTLQQSSSLVLGDKGQSMETINQLYYNEKPITKNELPESTMRELRATHFNLGGAKSPYETEMGGNYHKPPIDSLAMASQCPNYESGTWVPKNSKLESGTTNRRELPNRPVEPYHKHEPRVKGGFALGSQGNSYGTEFSQNFQPKEGSYSGKASKPEDNVVTGLQKGSYVTEHRASYIDRDLKQARASTDIASKSKVDHFQIGGSSEEYKLTVYQDEYRRDQENKSKIFHKDNQ